MIRAIIIDVCSALNGFASCGPVFKGKTTRSIAKKACKWWADNGMGDLNRMVIITDKDVMGFSLKLQYGDSENK